MNHTCTTGNLQNLHENLKTKHLDCLSEILFLFTIYLTSEETEVNYCLEQSVKKVSLFFLLN